MFIKKTSSSNAISNKVITITLNLIILTFLSLLPFFTIYIDLVVLNNNIGEISVTEIVQEILLFITITIFWYIAWKDKKIRSMLILIASFFSMLFIREMDFFLDYIQHGFWFWIDLPFALFVLSYIIFFSNNSIIKPLIDFTESKAFIFLVIGLIILLLLSRTLGSGNLLWNHLLPVMYAAKAKTVVQEGLELFGYDFIFYGSIIYYYIHKSASKT